MHRAHQRRDATDRRKQVRGLAAVGVDDVRRQVFDEPPQAAFEKRVAAATGQVERHEAHGLVEGWPEAFVGDCRHPFAKRRQAAGEIGEVRLQAAGLVAAHDQANIHRRRHR